jgi:hypothetical protein
MRSLRCAALAYKFAALQKGNREHGEYGERRLQGVGGGSGCAKEDALAGPPGATGTGSDGMTGDGAGAIGAGNGLWVWCCAPPALSAPPVACARLATAASARSSSSFTCFGVSSTLSSPPSISPTRSTTSATRSEENSIKSCARRATLAATLAARVSALVGAAAPESVIPAMDGRGRSFSGYATPVEGETTYNVDEAAAILQETPARVREMLASGEIQGIPPGATVSGDWKVLLPATLRQSSDQAPPVEEPTDSSAEEQEEALAADEGPDEFVEPPRSAADAMELRAASEESSHGGNAATHRNITAPSGWVSTQQAAKALGISPRTVRWHIEQGNLEAKTEGEGVKRTWLVSIDSIQAFRDTRQAAGSVPRGYRAPAESANITADTPSNAIRVLAERLEDAAARAAEYRVRLELTEQATSSVQAELAEERRRREAAERERDDLRRELEARGEAPREAREWPERPAPTKTPAWADRVPQIVRQRAFWRRFFRA